MTLYLKDPKPQRPYILTAATLHLSTPGAGVASFPRARAPVLACHTRVGGAGSTASTPRTRRDLTGGATPDGGREGRGDATTPPPRDLSNRGTPDPKPQARKLEGKGVASLGLGFGATSAATSRGTS